MGLQQTFPIRVKADGSNTIKDIKDLIYAYDGKEPLRQWLLYSNQSLSRENDEDTLARYDIRADSTIYMSESGNRAWFEAKCPYETPVPIFVKTCFLPFYFLGQYIIPLTIP